MAVTARGGFPLWRSGSLTGVTILGGKFGHSKWLNVSVLSFAGLTKRLSSYLQKKTGRFSTSLKEKIERFSTSFAEETESFSTSSLSCYDHFTKIKL